MSRPFEQLISSKDAGYADLIARKFFRDAENATQHPREAVEYPDASTKNYCIPRDDLFE
jgi:hypothetical protein